MIDISKSLLMAIFNPLHVVCLSNQERCYPPTQWIHSSLYGGYTIHPALYGRYIHPYIVDIPTLEGRIYPALYEEDIMTRTHKED
jgi:hypothetical protein